MLDCHVSRLQGEVVSWRSGEKKDLIPYCCGNKALYLGLRSCTMPGGGRVRERAAAAAGGLPDCGCLFLGQLVEVEDANWVHDLT